MVIATLFSLAKQRATPGVDRKDSGFHLRLESAFFGATQNLGFLVGR
jgi:hypothetical protein